MKALLQNPRWKRSWWWKLTGRGNTVLGRVREDDLIDDDPILLMGRVFFGTSPDLALLFCAYKVSAFGVLKLAPDLGPQVSLKCLVVRKPIGASRTHKSARMSAGDVLPRLKKTPAVSRCTGKAGGGSTYLTRCTLSQLVVLQHLVFLGLFGSCL